MVHLRINHTQGPRRESNRHLDVLLHVARDLTFLVAAEISGAPGVFAHDRVGVVDYGVAPFLRAGEARAEVVWAFSNITGRQKRSNFHSKKCDCMSD